MQGLQKCALVLLIIGGINWALVGIADFNLVEAIFGIETALTRIIYVLVGISAIISLSTLFMDFNSKRITTR